MGEIVGHWLNLSEAQKLTQSELLAGVVEEVVMGGQLLRYLPVKQIRGKSLLYNREKSWTLSAGASYYNIHEPIPWTSDVDYATQVESTLVRIARQDPIDKFMAATYGNVNDYRAMMIAQLAKRVTMFKEDQLIYSDVDSDSKSMTGLHYLMKGAASTKNIDMNGALGLSSLRQILDEIKVDQKGRDNVIILCPREVGRKLDEGYQEAGFVRSSVTVAPMSMIVSGQQIGGRIMTFDGIPIIRSDFLVAEQDDSDLTSVRGKYSTGTKTYSMFAIRFGQLEDGGLCSLFGADTVGNGEFAGYRHESFDKLENYDAGGERLVSYYNLGLGSTLSLARISFITDAAVVP